jgi:hypothetical protein
VIIMARKSSDESSDQAASSPSKTEAVKKAIADGMTSPKEISQHVKTAYGLDITPNYISMIKGNLKKKAGEGGKPGRKPKAEKATARQPAASPAPAAMGGRLSPDDLRTLTELARRAGGFGHLREFINVLGDLR